jgi:hypothetical protein
MTTTPFAGLTAQPINATNIKPTKSWGICLDDFEDPNEVLEFDEDALAIVLALKRLENSSYDIYDRMSRSVQLPKTCKQDRLDAKAIYSHFKNKFMMMRLREDYISKFLIIAEKLCNGTTKIKREDLAPLVALPKLYKEDIVLNGILAKGNSLDKSLLNSHGEIDNVVNYVGKLVQRRKNSVIDNHFWKDEKGHLYRLSLRRQDSGIKAWDFIGKIGKVHMLGSAAIKKIEGTDFHAYYLYTTIDLDIPE